MDRANWIFEKPFPSAPFAELRSRFHQLFACTVRYLHRRLAFRKLSLIHLPKPPLYAAETLPCAAALALSQDVILSKSSYPHPRRASVEISLQRRKQWPWSALETLVLDREIAKACCRSCAKQVRLAKRALDEPPQRLVPLLRTSKPRQLQQVIGLEPVRMTGGGLLTSWSGIE